MPDPASVAAFARRVRDGTPSSLSELAREAGLRARRVRLRRREWWREDLGPLVARHAGEAVALVPSVGGYELLASDGGARRVDATLAQAIEPDAWTLHAPVPEAAAPATLTDPHGLAGHAALAAAVPVPAAMLCLAWARWVSGSPSALIVLAAAALLLVGLRTLAGLIALRRHGEACRSAGPRLWDRVLRLRGPWLRAQDPVELAGALRRADALPHAAAGTTRAAVAAGMLGGALIAAWLLAPGAAAGLAALGLALVLALAAVDAGVDEIEVRIADLATRSGALVADGLEALATLRTLGLLDALRARDVAMGHQRRRLSRRRGTARAVRAFVALAGATAAAAIALALSAGAALVSAGLVWLAALELAAALRVWRAARHARVTLAPLFAAPAEPPVSTGRRVAAADALRIRGLSYARPGAARPVLAGVDLEVAPGEVVALQGASGAGKSTLLRLLLGLDTPDAGEVSWSGVPLAALDPVALRARVGVVLQDQRPPGMSLRAILAGPSTLDEEAAWSLACEVGLAGELQALPMGLETLVGLGTLSPAAEQRLLVGRALANDPDFVILDETLSALDPAAQQELVEVLRRRRVSCLLIGHGALLATCADRACTLVDGRLHASPAPARARPRSSAAEPPPLPPPPVKFRAAARHRLMTPLRSDDPAPVLTRALLATTLRRILDGAVPSPAKPRPPGRHP